jgi:hypothetical protein
VRCILASRIFCLTILGHAHRDRPERLICGGAVTGRGVRLSPELLRGFGHVPGTLCMADSENEKPGRVSSYPPTGPEPGETESRPDPQKGMRIKHPNGAVRRIILRNGIDPLVHNLRDVRRGILNDEPPPYLTRNFKRLSG